MNENKFIFILRAFLSNDLPGYLIPRDLHDSGNDSQSLMLCNRATKKIIRPKIIQSTLFLSSELKDLDKEDFDQVRRVVVNTEDIFSLTIYHLPDKLTTLVLDHRYNRPINALPQTLTRLVFGAEYNCPLEKLVLPHKLTSLVFESDVEGYYSSNFNQPLDTGTGESLLPDSLTYLDLGHMFNQPLEIGSLPSGLIELHFGVSLMDTFQSNFDHPFKKNVLPGSLKKINLCSARFNQSLDPVFPESLESLCLGFGFNQPINHGVLPQKLIKLKFGQHSQFMQSLKPGVLPDSLMKLSFKHHYLRLENNVLPESLVHLKARESWFVLLMEPYVFPKKLVRLSILSDDYSHYNEKHTIILPKTITHLTFITRCGKIKPLNKYIFPESLLCLKFIGPFNQPIKKNVLPKSLTHLEFGCHYPHLIDKDILPTSLTHLVFKGSVC